MKKTDISNNIKKYFNGSKDLKISDSRIGGQIKYGQFHIKSTLYEKEGLFNK